MNSATASYCESAASGGQVVAVRKAEGRDAEFLFPGHVQGGSARDEDPQPRRAGEQLGDKRRGAHELLEVVEDEQQLALAQEILHALLEVAIERLPDAQCGGESGGGGQRGREHPEADEEGAVGEIRQEARCEREPEAGLARAARAGQRHQASSLRGAR